MDVAMWGFFKVPKKFSPKGPYKLTKIKIANTKILSKRIYHWLKTTGSAALHLSELKIKHAITINFFFDYSLPNAIDIVYSC